MKNGGIRGFHVRNGKREKNNKTSDPRSPPNFRMNE